MGRLRCAHSEHCTGGTLSLIHILVNEIIRRLSDEKLRNDSIGVVTFSSVQQNLSDDMLVDAFAKNPDKMCIRDRYIL